MSDQLYDIWWQDTDNGEQSMEDDHLEGWQQTIDTIVEPSLEGMTVLDFGCNQGGFLRHLYHYSPYKKAVGVDLAKASIKVANKRIGDLPITYEATGQVELLGPSFDMAFSTSVIYLIKDLAQHAWQMKQVLKPNGVYYATFTDQSTNPSLAYMKKQIDQYGTTPMQLHNLDDIANAFIKEGFLVELKRVTPQQFVRVNRNSAFYQRISDRMLAEYELAYVFRFIAPNEEGE
ncbi:class I SAM-dependent methyltransferase [Paraliobacillus sediminis]|uniref:class I SAM-dependent methyltransferase n=1 Tax=Paraliobacillus sediminis TaxID=1885916 RepID=UPI000E3BD77E|nr:class I SAM-dependent methyltransferase [Paraliobacillus sediminis]